MRGRVAQLASHCVYKWKQKQLLIICSCACSADIPRLTLEPLSLLHSGEVVEGANVTMICHVRANPPASQISWQMDGHAVTAVHGVSISNFSLTLSGVGRQHSGRYVCVSANVEGEGISNQILLKVLCESAQTGDPHPLNPPAN